MDLIEQLLNDRQAIHDAAGAGWLGDDDLAVLVDLGDGIADIREIGHVLVAGIGEIPSGDLRAAFEQMPGKSPGGEPIPAVGAPPEGMQQGAKRERGIGNAAGYDDVGVLIERLRNP